jgi:aminoglycoside phosphotransferase (APT) family kinase protein
VSERRRVVEAALGHRVEDYREIDEGWDSVVAVADEEWIFRFPRRPEVEQVLESEIALLPELAPTLPVAVPRFEHVVRSPLMCVGYRMIEGEPFTAAVPPEQVAAFLSALHRFDATRASELGVRRPQWRAHFIAHCDELAREVLPFLDRAERNAAEGLFAEVEGLEDFNPVVAHVDLGPEHLLCRAQQLVGVIDWGDVHVGDPAIDFAWLLHAQPPAYGEALLAAYEGPVDERLRERARFYYRLSPWWEAHYGATRDKPERLRAGLRGIRERLVL